VLQRRATGATEAGIPSIFVTAGRAAHADNPL
jgi:hypothetical protein